MMTLYPHAGFLEKLGKSKKWLQLIFVGINCKLMYLQ